MTSQSPEENVGKLTRGRFGAPDKVSLLLGMTFRVVSHGPEVEADAVTGQLQLSVEAALTPDLAATA